MASFACATEDAPLLPKHTKTLPERPWLLESAILVKSALPLILTYLLQYSLPVVGLIMIGRLGSVELAAASLGTMTANITGYAVYQGLATGLDTLCAQAFGAGDKKMVAVHFQKMVCFLWLCTIPIGLIWCNSKYFFHAVLVDEERTVELTAMYLKIILLGAPGWAVFECGKRFLQAQGIFTVNLQILLLLAPVNAFLQWLFVLHLNLGFVGSPMAVAVTNNLFALCLWFWISVLGYGRDCWTWPSRRLLCADWKPMVSLALPGFAMLVSEWVAFEILTLWAGFFGAGYLAAQGTLITVANVGAQTTIPVALAAATRVANLIGAGQVIQAKRAGTVAACGASLVALFNMLVLLLGVRAITTLFSLSGSTREHVEDMLPLVAVFQLLDAANTCSQGLLRGLGSQRFGGFVALVVINCVALPLSYIFGVVFNWRLLGLWLGPIIAIAIVLIICSTYLCLTNWDRAVQAASLRRSTTE